MKTESLFEWKSPKKLKFLLAQIQGLPLEEALQQMQFSAKGQSDRVLAVLQDLKKYVKEDKKDPKEMVIGKFLFI